MLKAWHEDVDPEWHAYQPQLQARGHFTMGLMKYPVKMVKEVYERTLIAIEQGYNVKGVAGCVLHQIQNGWRVPVKDTSAEQARAAEQRRVIEERAEVHRSKAPQQTALWGIKAAKLRLKGHDGDDLVAALVAEGCEEAVARRLVADEPSPG